jgi:hypothetical protein
LVLNNEGVIQRKRGFLGSYVGLLLGWFGVLIITAGVCLTLRELEVFSASKVELWYWGKVILATTAAIYAVVMFAMTWSFARAISVQFLPAMAFAIWGAIPIGNLLSLAILMILASRREEKPTKKGEAQEDTKSAPPPVAPSSTPPPPAAGA